MKIARHLAVPAILCAWGSALTGCGGGESHRDVTDRFQPEYQQLRSELAELAKLVPDTVTPTTTPPALDPKPSFQKGVLKSNTVVLMFDQMLDPDTNLQREKKLDFYGANNMIRNLQWTGPKDPRTDSLKNSRGTDRLAREMQYPLEVRYLAVARTYKHQRARATSKDHFTGGGVAMGLFLIDRKSKTVVAQGGIVARSSDKVEYRYSETSDPVAALEAWANSTIWENALSAAMEKFAEISGGSFR